MSLLNTLIQTVNQRSNAIITIYDAALVECWIYCVRDILELQHQLSCCLCLWSSNTHTHTHTNCSVTLDPDTASVNRQFSNMLSNIRYMTNSLRWYIYMFRSVISVCTFRWVGRLSDLCVWVKWPVCRWSELCV